MSMMKRIIGSRTSAARGLSGASAALALSLSTALVASMGLSPVLADDSVDPAAAPAVEQTAAQTPEQAADRAQSAAVELGLEAPVVAAENPQGALADGAHDARVALVIDTSKHAAEKVDEWKGWVALVNEAAVRNGSAHVTVTGVGVSETTTPWDVADREDAPNWERGLAPVVNALNDDPNAFTDVVILSAGDIAPADFEGAVATANVLKNAGIRVHMLATGGDAAQLQRIAPDATTDIPAAMKALVEALEAGIPAPAEGEEAAGNEAAADDAESGDAAQSGDAAESDDDADLDLELMAADAPVMMNTLANEAGGGGSSEEQQKRDAEAFGMARAGQACMVKDAVQGGNLTQGHYDASGTYCIQDAYTSGTWALTQPYRLLVKKGVVRDGLTQWGIDGWHLDASQTTPVWQHKEYYATGVTFDRPDAQANPSAGYTSGPFAVSAPAVVGPTTALAPGPFTYSPSVDAGGTTPFTTMTGRNTKYRTENLRPSSYLSGGYNWEVPPASDGKVLPVLVDTIDNPQGGLWKNIILKDTSGNYITPVAPDIAFVFDATKAGAGSADAWAAQLEDVINQAHKYALPGTKMAIYAMGFEGRGVAASHEVREEDGYKSLIARLHQVQGWARTSQQPNNWDKALWEVAQCGVNYSDVIFMGTKRPDAWGEDNTVVANSDIPMQYAALSSNTLKMETGARVIALSPDTNKNAGEAYSDGRMAVQAVVGADVNVGSTNSDVAGKFDAGIDKLFAGIKNSLTQTATVELELRRSYDQDGPDDNGTGNHRGEPYTANGKVDIELQMGGAYWYYDALAPTKEERNTPKTGTYTVNVAAQPEGKFKVLVKAIGKNAPGFNKDHSFMKAFMPTVSQTNPETGIEMRLVNRKGADATVNRQGKSTADPFIPCTITPDGQTTPTFTNWYDPNIPQDNRWFSEVKEKSGVDVWIGQGVIAPIKGEVANIGGKLTTSKSVTDRVHPGETVKCTPYMKMTQSAAYFYDAHDKTKPENLEPLRRADMEFQKQFPAGQQPALIADKIWNNISFTLKKTGTPADPYTSSQNSPSNRFQAKARGWEWLEAQVPTGTISFSAKVDPSVDPDGQYRVIGWRYNENKLYPNDVTIQNGPDCTWGDCKWPDYTWPNKLDAEHVLSGGTDTFTFTPDLGQYRSYVPTVLNLQNSAIWYVDPTDQRPEAGAEWFRLTEEGTGRVWKIAGDGTCTAPDGTEGCGLPESVDPGDGVFWIRGLSPEKSYTLKQVTGPDHYFWGQPAKEIRTQKVAATADGNAANGKVFLDFGTIHNKKPEITWHVTPKDKVPASGDWWKLESKQGVVTLGADDDCVGLTDTDTAACYGMLDQDPRQGWFKVQNAPVNGDDGLTLTQLQGPTGYLPGQAVKQTFTHDDMQEEMKGVDCIVDFGEVKNTPVALTWHVTPEQATVSTGWWTLTPLDADLTDATDKAKAITVDGDCAVPGATATEDLIVCQRFADKDPRPGYFRVLDGIADVDGYQLTQSKVPAGYIQVPRDSGEDSKLFATTAGGAKSIDFGTVKNTMESIGIKLPMTGGTPSDLYWILGLAALLTGAGVFGGRRYLQHRQAAGPDLDDEV